MITIWVAVCVFFVIESVKRKLSQTMVLVVMTEKDGCITQLFCHNCNKKGWVDNRVKFSVVWIRSLGNQEAPAKFAVTVFKVL